MSTDISPPETERPGPLTPADLARKARQEKFFLLVELVGVKQLAYLAGLNGAYYGRVVREKSDAEKRRESGEKLRGFGARAARTLEKAIGFPSLWMEQPIADLAAEVAKIAPLLDEKRRIRDREKEQAEQAK